nr:MAG: ORF2 [Torque teno polar bear virus 41]
MDKLGVVPRRLLLAGKAEARFKRWVSSYHRSLCGCSSVLNHYRWPTQEEEAGVVADTPGDGVADASTQTDTGPLPDISDFVDDGSGDPGEGSSTALR